MKTTIQICVTLTPENRDRLRWLAQYYGMSVSGWLATIINNEYTQTKLMSEHISEITKKEKKGGFPHESLR